LRLKRFHRLVDLELEGSITDRQAQELREIEELFDQVDAKSQVAPIAGMGDNEQTRAEIEERINRRSARLAKLERGQ
jgi:hypothetical protein